MDIPRQSRDRLKELVRAAISNEIFFSAQLHDPSLTGMVFMPVMFGALSYPVARPEGTVKPAAPSRPTRPTKGVSSPGEAGRKLEDEIKELVELLNRVEFRVRWGDATEAEVQVLKDNLAALNSRFSEMVEVAERKVQETHLDELGHYLNDLKAYRKARHAWRALVKDWEEGEVGLANRVASWDAGSKKWWDKINETLGVIYAFHKEALPRGINGYPMFTSCAYLHKLDWEIIRRAINREIERQKDIDLGDEPESGATL